MRHLLVVVALLAAAGTAVAQEPAGSIAIGFGLAKPFGGGECPVDDCGYLVKSLSGEGAFNITEHFAIVAGIGYGFATLNTSYSGVAIDASGNSFAVGGGVRVFGPPSQVRAFVDAMAAYGRSTTKATALGLRESVSVSGWSAGSGAGIDIALSDRVAIRLSGGFSLYFSDGRDTDGSFGGGAGLVFGIGG